MELHKPLNRAQWLAATLGILGIAGLVVGVALSGYDAARLYRSYLTAFIYWFGVSVGCLGWYLLHNLTGGGWGFAVQRLLAAAARTLPLMALLFLPLLPGMSVLYPWAAEGSDLRASGYLTPNFFMIRAVLYFAVWIGLAFLITRLAYRSDATAEPELWRRVVRLSAAGLALYVLTASFAAFDWLMSLEPDWFSSIYGWLALGRDALAGISFVVLVLGFVGRQEPVATLLWRGLLNDLGNVLLAALLAWAYLALMQFLVVWSANIPADVIWYERRTQGGWQWLLLALVALYVALPGFLLLLQPVKRRLGWLAAIAGLILLLRWLHVYWLVMPAAGAALSFYWADALLPLALGGVWLSLFFWQLRRHPLLPFNHPRLPQVLTDQMDPYEAR